MSRLTKNIRRLVVNPFATCVLALLLLLDAWTLPSHWTRGGNSRVGELIHCFDLSIQSQPPWYDALVVKERGEIRVLRPSIESWDEATKLLAENPSTVAILTYAPHVRRYGFWAITHEASDHKIEQGGGSSFTAADWLDARSAMLSAVFDDSESQSGTLQRLRREDFAEARLLGWGFVHNAASIGVFVLMCWSVRWAREYRAAYKAWAARLSLRRGSCPECGYSIVGLPTHTCPECGCAVKAKDPGEVPGS